MLKETNSEVTDFIVPHCPVIWLAWCWFNEGGNIGDLGVLCSTVNNDIDLNNS